MNKKGKPIKVDETCLKTADIEIVNIGLLSC